MFDIVITEQLFVTFVCFLLLRCMKMSDAMRAAASLYNNPRFNSESEIRIRNNKIRRQRIVRRQFILLGLSIAFVVFLLTLMNSTIKSSAQSEDFEPQIKYYKTVMVHADDTMWSIADSYYSADNYKDMGSYISEICKINKISDSGSIKAGEELIIPYFSSEFK